MAQVRDDEVKTLYPEIPSDLPQNVPTHPGKPLTHRYDSGKSSQSIIEPSTKASTKLASEVNFKPVTTINIANKSVYVKPVNNITPRNISPLPPDGSLKLPIRGERVLDLASDSQEKLSRQIDKTLTQEYSEPKAPVEAPPQPKTTPEPNTTTSPKAAVTPTTPTPPPVVPTPTVPPPSIYQVPPTPPTKEAVANQQPAASSGELGSLRNQLHQEQVQKEVSQKRVVELSNKYQSQLAEVIQEKNQLNTQINGLRNKLMEETKRRVASENRITADTNQLKTEVNRLKIERDGLLGQFKEAQNKMTMDQDLQAKSASANVKITELKAKLAMVEREKEDTEQKSIKLEALVSELKGGAKPIELKEVIIPKEIEDKSKDIPVRIIHPAPAIGKMAPQLTTIPNVVSGIVKDRRSLLLTEVIILVKDSAGNSVRALKSNKIGQFAISTPLPNGTYTMELEKENNEFDVVQINLEGKVMPPIELRAR